MKYGHLYCVFFLQVKNFQPLLKYLDFRGVYHNFLKQHEIYAFDVSRLNYYILSNLGFLHCRQILYRLSYEGKPTLKY